MTMNLLTITNEVLKIKNVSIKCVRILDIVPSNRRLEDSIGRGSGRTEKIEPDVCRYSLPAPGSNYKYQSDCKEAAYRWRNPK